ncbi:MAG: UDP-N-acetylmuramoyl-L-alanyl-D-glutamate--2,6-diaminopimelate ligase [Planctomycetaceae bacterium]
MSLNSMNLQQLLACAAASGEWRVVHSSQNLAEVQVGCVTADHRTVRCGSLFVAVRGARHDGHRFLESAVLAGAAAVVVEQPQDFCPVPQIIVPDSSHAFAALCMARQVGSRCPIVTAGITGTNGKTTSTWMLRSILQAAGLRCGLTGTIETSDGVRSQPSRMTTPPANDLAQHMSQLMQQQATHHVMEVSSHALVQQRCSAVKLSAAAVTNVTQDHFDYHGNEDRYLTAKGRIAGLLHPDAPLLLNLDDPGCRKLHDQLAGSVRLIPIALNHPDADLTAEVLHHSHRSQRIRLRLAQGDADLRLRLIGRHNVSNCLIAAGLAEQLGIRLSAIVEGLELLSCVPGRLERVDEGQPFQVLVDYAHTPDALVHCLETIRRFVPGRLLCVFGAGGDRDVSKRPLMGQAASEADYCIVTSDNPRSEDPLQIARQIVAGFPAGTEFEVEPDRRSAILRAFELAEPGDVVLLAGKGHEGLQEIGTQQLAFDDRLVARELLRFLEINQHTLPLRPAFHLQRSAS